MRQTQSGVLDAKNSQEAMMAIAAALDRIEAKLDAVPEQAPAWDDWDNPAVHRQPDVLSKEAVEASIKLGLRPSWDVDPAIPESDAAREARVIDAIAEGKSAQLATDVTVDVKPVSKERQDERYHFSNSTLKLDQELGTEEDWDEAYAKGGPAWLYAHRRDLVVQYSEAVKQVMVADLEQDDPQAAHEMARDILKQPSNPPQL